MAIVVYATGSVCNWFQWITLDVVLVKCSLLIWVFRFCNSCDDVISLWENCTGTDKCYRFETDADSCHTMHRFYTAAYKEYTAGCCC